jgi:hypothetical protein
MGKRKTCKTQKKFTTERTTYRATHPDFIWKMTSKMEAQKFHMFAAKSITAAMDKSTDKAYEKGVIRNLESWIRSPSDKYTEADVKKHQDEIDNISETIISEDGMTATANAYRGDRRQAGVPYSEVVHYKVVEVPNEVMKSDYIKSNSKLAKWINKKIAKYAEQLNCSIPRVFINRRDIVERFGESAVAMTSDSGCIGRCWFSGTIWLDVNYHDKKWGDNPKEFRKHLNHTIAHEMVHLKWKTQLQHKGSKQRRAFDRRVNQVVRGVRYD